MTSAINNNNATIPIKTFVFKGSKPPLSRACLPPDYYRGGTKDGRQSGGANVGNEVRGGEIEPVR